MSATDEDGMVTEIVRAASDLVVDEITELANKIYEKGYVPKPMQ